MTQNRYEVRATYADGQKVWDIDTLGAAVGLADRLRNSPDCTLTEIFDREQQRLVLTPGVR